MKRKLFICGTIVLCILLVCVKFTGAGIHTILGFLFTIIAGIHVGAQRKKQKYFGDAAKRVNRALIWLLITLVVSGILVHTVDVIWLKGVHIVSGLLCVAATCVHVKFHVSRKGVKKCFIKD